MSIFKKIIGRYRNRCVRSGKFKILFYELIFNRAISISQGKLQRISLYITILIWLEFSIKMVSCLWDFFLKDRSRKDSLWCLQRIHHACCFMWWHNKSSSSSAHPPQRLVYCSLGSTWSTKQQWCKLKWWVAIYELNEVQSIENFKNLIAIYFCFIVLFRNIQLYYTADSLFISTAAESSSPAAESSNPATTAESSSPAITADSSSPATTATPRKIARQISMLLMFIRLCTVCFSSNKLANKPLRFLFDYY